MRAQLPPGDCPDLPLGVDERTQRERLCALATDRPHCYPPGVMHWGQPKILPDRSLDLWHGYSWLQYCSLLEDGAASLALRMVLRHRGTRLHCLILQDKPDLVLFSSDKQEFMNICSTLLIPKAVLPDVPVAGLFPKVTAESVCAWIDRALAVYPEPEVTWQVFYMLKEKTAPESLSSTIQTGKKQLL
jgi:hypothetical protein